MQFRHAMLLKAIAFAAEKHRHQRRKDPEASPYINHPIDLANVLVQEAHVRDTTVLIAAILHDTLEDTETTPDELATVFGGEIRNIVMEVTDNKKLIKRKRKELQVKYGPHLTRKERLVKLADKICNLRDVAVNPPARWPLKRQIEYFDWAQSVIDGMRGTHVKLEALFDAVYALRPHARRWLRHAKPAVRGPHLRRIA